VTPFGEERHPEKPFLGGFAATTLDRPVIKSINAQAVPLADWTPGRPRKPTLLPSPGQSPDKAVGRQAR
jgi:hypothetical protein